MGEVVLHPMNMNVKAVAISLYLMLIYWVSMHFPALKTVFYPTLGAFCYLFVSRTFRMRELSGIAFGAVIASLTGCLLHAVYPGVGSFFLNSLIVIWMIRKFHWNAPPILAVAFVPYFINPIAWWIVPLSVLVSLGGLLLLLWALHAASAFKFSFNRARLQRSIDRVDA
ncbi:hypothetical protein [Paenibacillus koleovorans]|uniref:hypothetical protein n=1 Tax=Paenibacillus koleovorans TaxID=121608 RepID=UPI000FD904D6|nr:hypothetical protein [Paenibacillus koleovorans]